MKIACNILGTSENLERLRVLVAGAIKSSKHQIVMNFVAQGARPDFLPKEWNWIPSDHINPTNRHVHAMIERIASTDYDFNVFCDDDVIIDIDKMVDNFSRTTEPCLWTTWPGGGLAPHFQDDVAKNAGEFLRGKSTSAINVGFCSAVINRPFLQKAIDMGALPVLMNISEAISKRGFFPDLQLSILAWMLGVRNVTGNVNNGTCWPCFTASSLLCKTGSMWHVHATGESPMVPARALIECLKHAPFASVDELVSNLYPSLKRGVKAKDYIDKSLDIAYLWRPWRSRCPNIEVGGPYWAVGVIMNQDGTVRTRGGSCPISRWEACEGGFVMFDHGGERFNFQWKHQLGAAGIPPLRITNENGMLLLAMES